MIVQKSFALLALASLAGIAATGCGHTGALREEASVDLNCPEHRIHIVGGGRTKDVEGCGQRATYHWTGRTWTREGQPQGAPQQGGPPRVTPAQPAPAGPQPVRPPPASGPNAPLPPAQPPPGKSL
jgi:hypothetical protein